METSPTEFKTPGQLFQLLPGEWRGACRTWFEPGRLADESEVSGQIFPLLGGFLLRHEYAGTVQSQSRHGEETIAHNKFTKQFEMSWIDSFHMNYAVMISKGEATSRGFVVKGEYDVSPDTPRWGWRTAYDLIDDDHLTIKAFNISPAGEEALALQTMYERVK